MSSAFPASARAVVIGCGIVVALSSAITWLRPTPAAAG